MAAENGISFGVGGPQIYERFPVDPEEALGCIRRAEELGFHSLWVQEQAGFAARAGALDGLTLLSYAAAATRRIKLGMAVFLITFRNPIHLAKSLASLDQLSQGRLIVGVGLGAYTGLYNAYGLSAERRVARFNEALDLMRKLWTEEAVNFPGEFWQIKNANLLPKPFQKPRPPVWFGGGAPAALKRAVLRGDGFIGAGSSSTADFRSHAQIIRQELETAGKDPERFPIAKRVYLAVDRDRNRAAARLKNWFGLYYRRPEMAERVSVWGGAEECAEGLREIVAAGARLLVLNPVFDMREQMEVLAQEVIPRVSRR
jgi:probable F420-dependent oxidoreductase